MEKFQVLGYATIEAYRVNGAAPSLVPASQSSQLIELKKKAL